MSMASASRPYAGGPSAYPASPAPTTASSLNYSQYGSTSFGGQPPMRNPSASVSVSSSAYGVAPTYANRPGQGGGGGGGGGLRPPGGGAGGDGKKMESRVVARIHWRALKGFLAEWLEKESPTSRASAREKLTRLTKLQFQELSTDVYDELMRRLSAETGPDGLASGGGGGAGGAAPFLPVRDDFHPKRNQARQKLATLPKNRFKDLASDVFHELRRRYPEFEEEEEEQERMYDNPPPAPGPRPSQSQTSQPGPQFRAPSREGMAPTAPLINRLNSGNSLHQRQRSRNASQGSSVGSRPSISRDNTREMLADIRERDLERDRERERERERDRQPSVTAATNEVVVPNKSRMREEEIEVPYARDSQMMDQPQQQRRSSSRADSRRDSRSSSRLGLGNGGAMEMMSPRTEKTDDRDYYDRMSFNSNVTRQSKPGQQGAGGGAGGWDEEREQKIRAEYEFRIAGLERRTQVAEGERDEMRREIEEEKERRREYEDEVRGLKERSTTHASSLRSLQHELDIARDAADTARKHAEQASQAAEEEISQWRERCDGLEDELRRVEEEKAALEDQAGSGGADGMRELKTELHSLVDELNALSVRNDQLEAQREQDSDALREAERRVEEYRKKFDAVRIELRNLKATSTMFVNKPITDDHLPASADGNISDLNVSSFQQSIDGLLSAARSSTPSGVLPAMKAIVEAITEIGEDVKAFEAHPNLDVDASKLESLKHESTTRLNHLMQAARNHAMASGLSPISLIDAAAGHLSANVVEIIKLLKIRRSEKNREMRRSRSSMSIKDMVSIGRSGSPALSPGPSSAGPKADRVGRANGAWEREYGQQSQQQEERLREPLRRPTLDNNGRLATPPIVGGGSGAGERGSNFRINSFQSASSGAGRSDSFDLERKASVSSGRNEPIRPVVSAGGGSNGGFGAGRESVKSDTTSASNSSAVGPRTGGTNGDEYGGTGVAVREADGKEGAVDEEKEWEDLKPYLNTQSSLLVNSIQNLLAAIRTGGNGPNPALNEHLSEVIAIASSIVAVSSNSLPSALRREGDVLLGELVANTNKLSEAQEAGKGAGGYEKGMRQGIASASFGVAKSLKSLMKLGTE